MLPLLRPLFPFIAKVNSFKQWMEDYYGEVVKFLVLYFIKIFINFLESYINTQFKEKVTFIFKALLNSLEDLIKEFYISN